MRTVVVYESMFGSTRRVAEAIGEGVAEHGEVRVVEVGEADYGLLADADLLLVGGPTHTFSMSRPATRADAAHQAAGGAPALVSQGGGIREWLAAAPAGRRALAAAFDTKIDKSYVPGAAARAAQRVLEHHGYRPAAPAESFRVTGVQGPLKAGELERARAWGAEVAAIVATGLAAAGPR